MPGVVFLVVIPTANHERDIVNGKLENHYSGNQELILTPQPPPQQLSGHGAMSPEASTTNSGSNLNINLPENNAILRLEVELRDKNAAQNHRRRNPRSAPMNKQPPRAAQIPDDKYLVPMEKVLEELLIKLEIEHATWCCDKKGRYHHVVFPQLSGEPCETTLHCLTELGMGTKLNSSVSVLPCSVQFDAINDASNEEVFSDPEEFSKWNDFVESIKSKLTVKQVVDGVRAGGSLSFDYLLLIVTADSLAALGLVENNAPNITAAMLVSPLMGPVMSITFGTIISDHDLVKCGFRALLLGMLISVVFGFIFGLILGTTEMPWGFGDWPTEEMKGRGNARSLWMGILWALTSGTGVAVALLQGAVGPLIGVAISASLLPPLVNCGLFWALACIWLIYEDIKMPHLKGEPFSGNSSYQFLYTDYIPTEFLISGIVSGLLTVINVICIFATAIILLKIKEVAAPYTASPDLRRFWETDIRTVRKTNRSTIRRGDRGSQQVSSAYDEMSKSKHKNLETALEQALKEAVDDKTFRKVKRMSYSSNAADELMNALPIAGTSTGTSSPESIESFQTSKLNTDLVALDSLINALLNHRTQNPIPPKRSSSKFNRIRSLSRSLRLSPNRSSATSNQLHPTTMPTIPETNSTNTATSSWTPDVPNIRKMLNTIKNAPQRFSQHQDEESTSLAQNNLD